jgi:hypothetical protein
MAGRGFTSKPRFGEEMRMNATRIFILAILSSIFASAALAAPPECVGPPEWAKGKGPPDGRGKWSVTLLHCGCADDGTRLEFVEIRVSNRSKGHLMHVAGSFDSCSTDGETYLDFVRTGSDCQVDDGQPLLGDEIAFCSGQLAGEVCGDAVID